MSATKLFAMVTGYISLTAFAGLFLWLLFETLIGLVATVSFHRWLFACARINGEPIYWRKIPGPFMRTWDEFVGYRPGSMTARRPGGIWHGVGRWQVWRHDVRPTAAAASPAIILRQTL